MFQIWSTPVGYEELAGGFEPGPALIAVFFLKTEAAILHKYV